VFLHLRCHLDVFVVFATDNDCTYNDPRAVEYTGKQHINEENMTCIMWTRQRAYRDLHFPDSSVLSAENFCRNPKPVDSRAWCYSSEDAARKWGYCALRQCSRCHTFFVLSNDVLCDSVITVHKCSFTIGFSRFFWGNCGLWFGFSSCKMVHPWTER